MSMESVDLGVNPSNYSSESTQEPDINDNVEDLDVSNVGRAPQVPTAGAQKQKIAAAQQLPPQQMSEKVGLRQKQPQRPKKKKNADRSCEEGQKEASLTALASLVSAHSPEEMLALLQAHADDKGCEPPEPRRRPRWLHPKESTMKDTNFGRNLFLSEGELPRSIVNDQQVPNQDVELDACIRDIPLPKWFYKPPPVDMELFSCAQGKFEYHEGFCVAAGAGNSVQCAPAEQNQLPLPGHCDGPLKIHLFSSDCDDVAFKPGVACKKRIPNWVF